jgi:uncharacterized membrane protein YGL010W
MKTLNEQLTTYAAYHRDRRNIATHFVGVPLIVMSVVALLSRPAMSLAGLPFSPAVLVYLGAIAFYLAMDLRYGVTMALLMGSTLPLGASVAAHSTGAWLAISLGVFFLGWSIQFVGHYFEGRKPAFVDDLVGLLVGPLFVVAEASFALGLRPEVRESIEAQVGPTGIRRAGEPALGR